MAIRMPEAYLAGTFMGLTAALALRAPAPTTAVASNEPAVATKARLAPTVMVLRMGTSKIARCVWTRSVVAGAAVAQAPNRTSCPNRKSRSGR